MAAIRLFTREPKSLKPICYVLVFEQVDIIKQSLTFLCKHTDLIDIVVVENPSSKSKAIASLVKKFGDKGLVKRHYIFDENITGEAYRLVIKNELSELKKRQYIMITDGDLTSKNGRVIAEVLDIMKHNRGVFACGSSLDMSNLPTKTFPDSIHWVPPDKSEQAEYYEAITGGHLLALRVNEFLRCMAWLDKTNQAFVDGNMHTYCYEVIHRHWARTKNTMSYHLTWDLYNNKDHPYTRLKTGKSFADTWHHKKTSTYTLVDFEN